MSNKSEKISKERQDALKKETSSTDENIQPAAIIDLYSYKSVKSAKTAQLDAYDYLEKAQQAHSGSTAVKYAKMALELDPTLTDAKIIIAVKQSKSPEILQLNLEKLLREEEDYLKTIDITEENCAGDYYQIFETRPYLRAYKEYVEILVMQGKMRKAVQACNRICFLNESDNLGIRYTLMALYAYLEEHILAEELYQKYTENNSFMLLPLIAFYYKQDDTDSASKYLNILYENNKNIKKAIQILNSRDENMLMNIIESPYYIHYSEEEFIIAFMDNLFLYGPIPAFVKWLTDNIPKRKIKARK